MKQVLYDPFGEITISGYQILKLVTILIESLMLRLRSDFLLHRIWNAKTQTMTYVLFI